MRTPVSGHRSTPHRRRVRTASSRHLAGRAFWAVIAGAAALIITSGFAVGAFVIGSFTTNPLQTSATAAPGTPPGLTTPLAEAQIVNATSEPAAGACVTSNLGKLATPTALTDGTTTGICLNTPATGFATGDEMYILEVAWGTLAAPGTIFEIQIGMVVTPSTNNVAETSYVETSPTIATGEQAIFALDLTAASDTSVVQVNVLITQL